MERTRKSEPLSTQMRRRVSALPSQDTYEEYKGHFFGNNISTGSTLLDLAISGGRVRGGGIPAGILVEIFGPSGSGKTVLLSEIAGDIQSKGGEVKFHDPEARLNQQFAKMFGLKLKEGDYYQPDTIPEVFQTVRAWKPTGDNVIHGIMADSLAALSTDMEMTGKEGDKMGMRRPKEFSQELRQTCRILPKNNFLMVCSNQVRINVDGGDWGPKYTTPGGLAMEFYSSLRLQTSIGRKIKKEKKFHGKDISRIVGVEIEVTVVKSSVWKPLRSAPVTIIFDYGVDDIKENLQFIKKYSGKTVYTLGQESLGNALEDAIMKVERDHREEALRQEVILLWNKIESAFDSHRKPKRP